jgi:hypothetical protein
MQDARRAGRRACCSCAALTPPSSIPPPQVIKKNIVKKCIEMFSELAENKVRLRRAARCFMLQHAARGTLPKLHAARCTLHAARCTLHAARCTLHAARCTLHAARCCSMLLVGSMLGLHSRQQQPGASVMQHAEGCKRSGGAGCQPLRWLEPTRQSPQAALAQAARLHAARAGLAALPSSSAPCAAAFRCLCLRSISRAAASCGSGGPAGRGQRRRPGTMARRRRCLRHPLPASSSSST